MHFKTDQGLKGKFKIRNLGTSPLRLFEANVSCGCTLVDRIPGLLSPGESVTVDVQVKPKNSTGLQGSSILVRSDDSVSPSVRLDLRWQERYALTLQPTEIDFGWVDRSQLADRTVEAQIVAEVSSEIFEVISPDKFVTSVWMAGPRQVTSGGLISRKLRVRLEPGRDPGEGSTTLIVRDSGSAYTAKLPIRWNSGPPIVITPKALYHSAIRPKSDVMNRLIVQSKDGVAIRVARMTIDEKDYPIDNRKDGRAAETSVVTAIIRAGTNIGIEHHVIRLYVEGFGSDPLTVPVTLVVEGDALN